MELRHIYNIAEKLGKVFSEDVMAGADPDDAEIVVHVSPGTLYGIDREFYRRTNNGSTEGFKHRNKVEAKIGNIHFVITEKRGR